MLNSIICCDYKELLPRIEGGSVSAVVTDPPFWYKLSKQLYSSNA